MKLYIITLAIAALVSAAPNLEARAGCSQPGQYCNDGTFLCCRGTCRGNVVSLHCGYVENYIWLNHKFPVLLDRHELECRHTRSLVCYGHDDMELLLIGLKLLYTTSSYSTILKYPRSSVFAVDVMWW